MQELEKILEEIELEKKRLVFYPDCSSAFSAVQIRTIEKIEQIICKYMSNCKRMNDGWISVDERMPTEEECENEYFWIMLKYNTSPVIAKCSWIEADNVDGTDDSYPEFWIDQFPQIYRPSHRLIAAWKILELPETYIPRKER